MRILNETANVLKLPQTGNLLVLDVHQIIGWHIYMFIIYKPDFFKVIGWQYTFGSICGATQAGWDIKLPLRRYMTSSLWTSCLNNCTLMDCLDCLVSFYNWNKCVPLSYCASVISFSMSSEYFSKATAPYINAHSNSRQELLISSRYTKIKMQHMHSWRKGEST